MKIGGDRVRRDSYEGLRGGLRLRLLAVALWCAIILCVVAPRSALAAVTGGLIIGRSNAISSADTTGVYFESHLAVDPHNPRHMVAISSAFHQPDDYTAIYATFDGGNRWRRARMASNATPMDKGLFHAGD